MLSLRRKVGCELFRLPTVAGVSRQICLPSCSLYKMDPAQKRIPNPAGYSSIAADMPFSKVPSDVKQGHQPILDVEAMEYSGASSVNKEQLESRLSSYENEIPTVTGSIGSSSRGSNTNKRRARIDLGLQPRHKAVVSSETKGIADIAGPQHECSTSLSSHGGVEKVSTNYVLKPPSGYNKSKNSDSSEGLPKVERFNICFLKSRDSSIQKVLRPGMVLLKRYISLYEQINIVETCQTLGQGLGGFYRPGYKDGAKLRLNMMCLGFNWDPQTRKYNKRHPVDDCEPPDIPCQFHLLVQRAIQEAHCLIKKNSGVDNVEDVLPSMSSDICIINFYTDNGRLGLHQDRDESRESLHKGLPVVSFSIGNSAVFLYGDQRDEDQAKKLILESGDVIIFGGESRMVFHGVPRIIPKSAPGSLLAETGLRPGRLNLTFRQL